MPHTRLNIPTPVHHLFAVGERAWNGSFGALIIGVQLNQEGVPCYRVLHADQPQPIEEFDKSYSKMPQDLYRGIWEYLNKEFDADDDTYKGPAKDLYNLVLAFGWGPPGGH